MSEKDNTVYLKHILDAIDKIDKYLKGQDLTSFLQDTLVQDGIVRQIEIIGEATRHISPPLLDQYPEIPWQDIIGMRHKLIHDYMGIDLKAVWDTAIDDIPVFKSQTEKVLKELSKSRKVTRI